MIGNNEQRDFCSLFPIICITPVRNNDNNSEKLMQLFLIVPNYSWDNK